MEENNSNLTETNSEETKYHNDKECPCCKKMKGMLIAAFIGGFLAMFFVGELSVDRFMNKRYMEMERFIQTMNARPEMDFRNDFRHNHRNDFRDDFRPHDRFDNPRLDERLFDMPSFEPRNINTTPNFMPNKVKATSEFTDGNYNITVDLNPFQGDENKIKYRVKGRTLNVFGESKIIEGKRGQITGFSHNYTLPQNADTANIKKIKEGNRLIISVPIKQINR